MRSEGNALPGRRSTAQNDNWPSVLGALHNPAMSDSETEDESGEMGSEEDSWIAWFCALKGNEFFCEVDEDFIQDDFNLSGLSNQVPYYDYALDLIMDIESDKDMLTEQQQEVVESAAELLYGLIHSRYIVTARGLQAMLVKCRNCDFGRCPRVLCNGQPCLAYGSSDIPRQGTVKVFCPKCEDIYYPRSKFSGNVDGAFFGTTFAHLLLMTYPSLRPTKATEKFVPRVFGFKIHKSAYATAALPNGRDRQQGAAMDVTQPDNRRQAEEAETKKEMKHK